MRLYVKLLSSVGLRRRTGLSIDELRRLPADQVRDLITVDRAWCKYFKVE